MKTKNYIVYPANKVGKLIKGFCPTSGFHTEEEAKDYAMKYERQLRSFKVKFHSMIVEEL